MIIAARWITFLIWAPHVFVYRRWGWTGIAFGWTSLIVVGALSQWLGDGDTSKGQIQMVVVGAVIIAFLLLRLLTAGQAPQTTSRADDITGQGVFAMDFLYLRYLTSVMQRGGQASDADIGAAVRAHSRRLADSDPNAAWNYRTDTFRQSTAEWPAEASHDFDMELERDWAPSAEDAARWAQLPVTVRTSYIRQGRLMQGAVLKGLGAA